MRLSEIMTRRVRSVTPEATIREVAEVMRDEDVGSVPVVRDGMPVGMITDRDIVVRVLAQGQDPAAARAEEAMTDHVSFCREDDSLHDATEVMESRQIRRLMVLDSDDRLCGIVSLGDLVNRMPEPEKNEISEEVLEEVSKPGHARG